MDRAGALDEGLVEVEEGGAACHPAKAIGALPSGAMGLFRTMVALAFCSLFAAMPALAAPAAGLRPDGAIVVFDTTTPASVPEAHPVTGLAAGYGARDVDVRPANARLYLVAASGSGGNTALRLYGVDPGTGVATPVGSVPFATVSGSPAVAIDFDGAADVLRVVTSSDRNIRVDPDTGTAPAPTPLAPTSYEISSIAHDGAGLFGWDSPGRRLMTVASDGAVAPVSGAGGPLGTATGFDVGADGAALLVIGAGLHQVDLATGTTTPVGALPQPLTGLALLRTTALGFTAGEHSVNEAGGSATVAVSRPTAAGTMTVRYATDDGTATEDDYTPTTGTLTFGPGVTTRSFEVPIVDDGAPEPAQTVELSLSRPTGGGSLGTSEATLTIADDEQLPPRADRIGPRVSLKPDTRRLSFRSLLTKGLPGSFTCSEACRGEIALRRRTIVLGAGGEVLPGPGPGRFKARLSAGGKRLLRRQLRRRAQVRVSVVLNAVDPARNVRTARVRVVVRR